MRSDLWMPLSSQQYDRELGWLCPVLVQANGKLEEFRMNGETVPLEKIKVDGPYIRFIHLPPGGVRDAAVKIGMQARRAVDTQVVVALIALVGTVVSAAAVYLASVRERDDPIVAQKAEQKAAQDVIAPEKPSTPAAAPETGAKAPPENGARDRQDGKQTGDARVGRNAADAPRGAGKREKPARPDAAAPSPPDKAGTAANTASTSTESASRPDKPVSPSTAAGNNAGDKNDALPPLPAPVPEVSYAAALASLKKGAFAEAASSFKVLASAGDAKAQYQLANLYLTGQGVQQNDKEAHAWYFRAANAGLPMAQHNLAVMYEKGRGGPQDEAEALRWYRKAAREGYAPSQKLLQGNDLGW